MKENLLLFFKSFSGIVLFTLLVFMGETKAQEQVTVQGSVKDAVGGIPGVSVKVSGTTKGVSTDPLGRFKIVADRKATLVFSLIGMITKEIKLSDHKISSAGVIELDVTLKSDDVSLEEVTVTGFGGKQKKASLVSSITSVNVEDLKQPTSNLTNALAGRVAGLIAFQTSGEPGIGTDNSQFFIRGLSTFGAGRGTPLILIDGIESEQNDLARLQPDDIADFSVLKDAAAASIYGARGANGVLLINTKMGKEGQAKFSFRAQNRTSTNTQNFQLADNITYMELANRATLARSGAGGEPYQKNKIDNTRAGADPYLYPNNDWMEKLIKDYTNNQSYNLNVSGGSAKARYYVAGTYAQDRGILKVEPINNFNSNIKFTNYSLRTNIDLNFTKTSTFIIRMYGQFDDYKGPIGGGARTFTNALTANPVMFPAVYPQSMLPYLEHPLFGGNRFVDNTFNESNTLYLNPYAELVRGYSASKNYNIHPQLEWKQDFNFITEGLTGRAMAYLRRTAGFSVSRSYNPFYYAPLVNSTDYSYNLYPLNDGSATSIGTAGTEYLNYIPGINQQESRIWAETSLNYNRVFAKKHAVGGMLVSYISEYQEPLGGFLETLPKRNAGVSGRFSYGYDDRYLFEFNFGYNGSERFAANNRFGFFPSGGIGYRISNERFFEPLSDIITNLKLRATYGYVGNDAIGDRNDRFFYMSNVSLNDGGFGASFGKNEGQGTYFRPGVSISRYANNAITWELSRQINIGLDLGIGKGFNFTVDAFRQYRSNILQPQTFIDNASGFMATPFSNYGKAESSGIDGQMTFNHNFTKDIWTNLRGTFTFATSKITKIDELTYPDNLSYLSRKGANVSQAWGYIAERLFVDETEVANSPVQFGDTGLLAGDIKYRDINGDGVINTDDRVPLGYPQQPELIYGFGNTFGYKNFDVSFYFQGSARSSFFINPTAMQPYVNLGNGQQSGLLNVIAQDHWNEENRDPYAFWPRLSTWRVGSNNETSTWWMRNGSFLRLKTAEMGYNFKDLKKVGINSARVYVNGQNLFMISKFKMWDAEMGGNGLGYPIQSVYNFGVQLNF